MVLCDSIKQEPIERRKICWKVLRKALVFLYLLFVLSQFFSFHIASVRSQSSSLLVFAEASSFARLDDIDPSGWFYQAVLYNPTDSDIVVTGLRWWYKASVKMVDGSRDVKCYDSRYFSSLPVTNMPNDKNIWWEYAPGSVSITVPAKEIIVTWIEVPTYSVNNDGIPATYYVLAYVDGWLSSPLYVSHSGHDKAVSTLFRADFNLTTDPNDEQQKHLNPQWLFNEDRSVIAGLSTRVRLIPIASSKDSSGIDYATINVGLPSGWSYVPGSAYNPYGETITPYSVDGKDRLKWDLDTDVLRYSTNRSMAQNYIEFNVTAPYVPGIHNFTVTSIITSLNARITMENQSIYAVVKKYPVAFFTYSPPAPVTNQIVSFNASLSTPEGGTIVNYTWDFDDGNVTTVSGPTINHTYVTSGQYNVTLTVTDNEGLSGSTSKIVKIRNPGYPVAVFTYEPAAPIVNEVIAFNASGSYDTDGIIVNYTWDFGDGTNATGMIVTHNYTAAGTYNVTLVIVDDEGFSDSVSQIVPVYIHDVAVVDVISSANEVHVGQVVNITVTVRNEGTATETFIVTLYYDLTPIETKIVFNMAPSTQTNLTFCWNTTRISPGFNYTIKAEASVVTGETETADNTYINGEIRVIKNPVASFTYSPDVPIANKAVTFDASLSMPEGGTIISYFWDFGDGTNGTGLITTHIYTDEGNYTVVLTVTDSEGLNHTDSKTIRVRKAPIAEFTYSPKAPIIGETVYFSASSSYDSDGTIISYFWSFGDGSNGTGMVVTHAYASAGTFNVALTVTDNDGCINSTSKEITVYIHDIKIVSVTASATEVLLGQTVNITVVVKNEGTAIETFNVTIYYNNTAIGTQAVVNLLPNAQTTLTFRWNTTGMEGDSIYKIKAEAEAVPGETDTGDNTYIGGNIKLSSQPINPDDTMGVLPYFKYVIPIGLALIGFLAAGIILKRGTGPKYLGFEFFDEITAKGIPDGYSVMIIGGVGSGKSMLCQQLAYKYLKQGKSCVYVTYDCFPDEVRKNMKNFHWSTSKFEQKGAFKFVDCYSYMAGVTSREEYHTEQPYSLSELSILISAAMGEGEERARSTRVFLDSTAPLFTRLEPAQVIKFLQDRVARIKGCAGIFFFTVGKGTVPSGLMRMLDEIVDCIVEIDIYEEKGKNLRKMRIRKLRGQKFVDAWIYFSINAKKGIVFSVPKDWSKIQSA